MVTVFKSTHAHAKILDSCVVIKFCSVQATYLNRQLRLPKNTISFLPVTTGFLVSYKIVMSRKLLIVLKEDHRLILVVHLFPASLTIIYTVKP